MATSQTVELPPEQPSVAARILLLSIEQSQANWLGQLDRSKALGERMFREVADAAGLNPAS